MTSTRTIAKNASALMVSQLVTWVLGLTLTIFLPRHLEDIGIAKLHLAISIWAIATIFISFGMDTYLTKQIARTPERASEFLSTTIFLRVPLYVIGFGVVALWCYLSGYPQDTWQIIVIIGVSQCIWQFASSCRAALEGLEQMTFISYAEVAAKSFNTVITLILIVLGYGLVSVAFVSIGVTLTYLLVHAYPLWRDGKLKWMVNLGIAKWMLKESAPYLTIMGLQVVYVQMDVIVMSLLVDERQVGWYTVVDQLFTNLLFVPSVFIMVVFPVFSRMHKNDPAALPALMQRSFNMLLLISIPIGFGLIAIANPIVLLIFGPKFVNSGPILAVMGVVLLLMYLNILLGRFLISIDRQSSWTWVMGAGVLLTIALDIVLVPLFNTNYGNGAIGGAVAYIVTEGCMLAIGLWLLADHFSIDNVWFAGRALLAGGIMLAAVWIVRDELLFIPIAVGAITYLPLVLLFKLVPLDDLRQVRSMLKPSQA